MLKDDKKAVDIGRSIHSPDKVDPFEGLDLDAICVAPQNQPPHPSKGEENTSEADQLFDLNPLDGIDLKDLSVKTEALPAPETKAKIPLGGQDDVNFIIIPGKESADPSDQERQKSRRPERSLSTDISHPPAVRKKFFINPIIEKAYHYSELTQIREKVFATLDESGGNSLLIASPLDNTGSSLLTAALGYNTAYSCQKKVLLIDCNMRRAGLHSFFDLPQAYGFTELIQDRLPWQAVVKETGVDHLHMITAGSSCDNFSEYLRHSHISSLMEEIRTQFDLIIFDTSPVLKPNRNNVNIASLSSVTDYFLLVIKKSGTTQDHLKETQNVIEAGNGKIDGIVLNEYTPDMRPEPFSK